MPEASKVQLLYFLFGIAKADGTVSTAEIGLLENISNRLGIDHVTFMSVKSMYYDDIESAYFDLFVSDVDPAEFFFRSFPDIFSEVPYFIGMIFHCYFAVSLF